MITYYCNLQKDSEIEFGTHQPERTQKVGHRNFLALQSAFLPPCLHADKQLLSQQHLHPWFPYSTVNNRNQSQKRTDLSRQLKRNIACNRQRYKNSNKAEDPLHRVFLNTLTIKQLFYKKKIRLYVHSKN